MARARKSNANPCAQTRARINLLPYFRLNSPPLTMDTSPRIRTPSVATMAMIIAIKKNPNMS